jgi:hypothetical protein
MELIYFFIALGIVAIALLVFAQTKIGKRVLD